MRLIGPPAAHGLHAGDFVGRLSFSLPGQARWGTFVFMHFFVKGRLNSSGVDKNEWEDYFFLQFFFIPLLGLCTDRPKYGLRTFCSGPKIHYCSISNFSIL
jgi:hypothetical protein